LIMTPDYETLGRRVSAASRPAETEDAPNECLKMDW
jgi:hypothetical protein